MATPRRRLLEVLDPAQNHTFRDHYLELDLDLSDVLFIATANVLETIPAPLLDRTEVISLDGYTDLEKVAIARDHLLPRQIRGAGLEPEEIAVTEDALTAVVDRYTREAGVRSLERELGKLARKVATKIARGEDEPRSSRSTNLTSRTTWASPRSGATRRRTAPPSPASQPAWRSPAPEAMCCSSRPPPWTANRA